MFGIADARLDTGFSDTVQFAFRHLQQDTMFPRAGPTRHRTSAACRIPF